MEREPQTVEVEVVQEQRESRTVEVEVQTPGAAPTQAAEQEPDDGMRFKCSACGAYLKPDPEGNGMKCDECGEWFTLCEQCMPDVGSYRDAVWLCPECR